MARSERRNKQLVRRIPGCRHLGPLRAASAPSRPSSAMHRQGPGERRARDKRPSRWPTTPDADPADRARAGVFGGAALRGAEGGVADERRHPPEPALLAARPRSTGQRRRPQGRLDAPDLDRFLASTVNTQRRHSRSSTDGVMYVLDRRRRRLRDRASRPVKCSGPTFRDRPGRQRRLLRLAQAAASRSARARSSSASSTPSSARSTRGPASCVWSTQVGAAAGLLAHRGAALLRRNGRHRHLRRRARDPRPRAGLQRDDGRTRGPSTPSPARASSAMTPGRRTTTSGSTAARRSGRRPPSTPSSG